MKYIILGKKYRARRNIFGKYILQVLKTKIKSCHYACEEWEYTEWEDYSLIIPDIKHVNVDGDK